MHAYVLSPGQAISAAAVDALDALIYLLARVTKRRAEDSTFLTGKLAPQPAEVRLLRARVDGHIPDRLRGMFCTVIPNGQQHLPVGGYHVFEGDGSLAAVRIQDGGASFSFRHMETEKLAAERALGRSPVLSVTAMKGPSGLALIALTELRNALRWDKYNVSTANTNVVCMGNRAYALMERDMPYELALTPDGTALQCTSPLQFDAYQGPFSAHPVHSPFTNCYYSVSYTPYSRQDASIVVVNANAELVRVVPLHLGRALMIHDAAVTENYLVVLDLPLIISPDEILKRDGSLVRVHHDKPARIGLFPVDATHESDMLWFDVPPCFVFHAVNAYEADGKVVLHLCQMEDFRMQEGYTVSTPQLVRYELDLATRASVVETEAMDFKPWFGNYPVHVDLPAVNEAKYGSDARYAFGICMVTVDDTFQQLRGIWKYDLHERRLVDVICFEKGAESVGEAKLVPRSNATHEDEMDITVFVRDSDYNVAMHIYDARTMSSDPMARVHAPAGFHVPSGFHSEFISEEKLRKMPRLRGGETTGDVESANSKRWALAGFDL